MMMMMIIIILIININYTQLFSSHLKVSTLPSQYEDLKLFRKQNDYYEYHWKYSTHKCALWESTNSL